MKTHHIKVAKTARYYQLGEISEKTKEVWFVCHGYGQLAEKFAQNFAGIVSAARVIVAPEGLSRFYLSGFSGWIGASWMTREDRHFEIDDYVAYLDGVAGEVLGESEGPALQVTALGFSQGVAAACRWTVKGAPKIGRLILWAGEVPPDLTQEELTKLREVPVCLVLGRNDEYADSALLDKQKEHLEANGIDTSTILFDGGHEVDPEIVLQISRS